MCSAASSTTDESTVGRNLNNMVINSEAFNAAMSIISKSNSVQISINVPVKDNYSNVYALLIHSSNAEVINRLVADGFSLSMCNKGLNVDYYGDKYDWTKVWTRIQVTAKVN